MKRSALRPLLVALLLAFHALPAGAEVYVSLNDGTVPLNDQPAAATYGSTTHVAWIGGPNGSGGFSLYYAAYNAASDFEKLTLTRDTAGFLRVPPMEVADNTAGGGPALADVRHPWIGLLGSDRVVILFQGKESPGDPWGLYRATFLFRSDTVSGDVSVVRIDAGSGEATFPSAGLWKNDGTARIVYGFDDGSAVDGRLDVRYVRVGVENGVVLAPPRTLTSWDGLHGRNRSSLPLPSLSLDPSGRAHVAWTAEGEGADASVAGVWYAMVKVTNGADNVQIAPTNVIGRSRSWSRAQAHSYVSADKTNVFVTAWDNAFSPRSGSIGMVHLMPDEAAKDGNPVNLSENRKFFLSPPGEAILASSFDLWRPTATVDKGGRIFLAGYGTSVSPVTYEVVAPLALPSPTAVTYPVPAGFGTPYLADSPAGGLTFPAIAYYSDRAFLFWSGFDNTDAGRRNLNVTSVLTTKQWVDVDQSGCAAAGGPGADPLLAAAVALPLLALLRRLPRRAGGPPA